MYSPLFSLTKDSRKSYLCSWVSNPWISLALAWHGASKNILEHRELIKKEFDNISKLFGPVLLICSINSRENPEINSYYTMVTKDSFETAYKGKMTSSSSMEQAVGGLWCVFTLVLTDQRL